jgi:ribosomal protein S18 acetylase RimI-like enzyme
MKISNFLDFNESNIAVNFKYKIWYFDNINIDFKCVVDGEVIGTCIADIIFKNDKFDKNASNIWINNDNNIRFKQECKKEDLKKYRHIGYISNFEIKEEYQGKGYGSKFIQYIVNFVISRYPKVEGIYLAVENENKSAISIYNKSGFTTFSKHGMNSMYMEYIPNKNESISGTEMIGSMGPNYGEEKLPIPTTTDTEVLYSPITDTMYTRDEYLDLYNDYLKNGGKPLFGFNKENLDKIVSYGKR